MSELIRVLEYARRCEISPRTAARRVKAGKVVCEFTAGQRFVGWPQPEKEGGKP